MHFNNKSYIIYLIIHAIHFYTITNNNSYNIIINNAMQVHQITNNENCII